MQMGGQVECNYPMGSLSQELALRRVATQRQTGGSDHELDIVCEAQWS
jgi:hypothetical protein